MLNAVSMTRTLEFVQKCLLYQVEETKEDVPEEAVLMCADLVSLAIGSDVSQIGATQLLRVAASSLAKLVELFPGKYSSKGAAREWSTLSFGEQLLVKWITTVKEIW